MTDRRQTRDGALGMDRPIDRRDFLNGVAVAIGAIGAGGLADAIGGEDAGFELFADVEPAAFPGGVALRAPLHVLGMLWYALRDRVG